MILFASHKIVFSYVYPIPSTVDFFSDSRLIFPLILPLTFPLILPLYNLPMNNTIGYRFYHLFLIVHHPPTMHMPPCSYSQNTCTACVLFYLFQIYNIVINSASNIPMHILLTIPLYYHVFTKLSYHSSIPIGIPYDFHMFIIFPLKPKYTWHKIR